MLCAVCTVACTVGRFRSFATPLRARVGVETAPTPRRTPHQRREERPKGPHLNHTSADALTARAVGVFSRVGGALFRAPPAAVARA